ncbi:hypothetical protein C5Y97_26390 [Blastopirellula marina]|uniref:GYF domain-containing protein n=1 Tax=Blastopirellula marina TaxID=124 RepID=A0A2S8F6S1_9BACT|nr:hypothetical protein C5Y98_26375 [Blastopirellula marina]PTL41592.1 hypothetical protein C5Y97_26390 [Blastopirellula marina]
MQSEPQASQPALPEDGPLFHVRIPEGQIFGPVPLRQIDQWVIEGRIDDHCDIREAGSGNWKKSFQYYPILELPEEVGAGTPFHNARKRQTQATYCFPHRGGASLLFAVFGLMLVCPIFSIAAWSMAYADLEGIEQERVDPSGRTMLVWAHNLGMIGSIGYAVMFLAFLMVAMLAAFL